MRQYFNIISLFLFIINVIICVMFFNGMNLVPDEAIFPVTVGGSIIGTILTLFGKKEVLRVIGLIGNSGILILMIIIPFIVRTFIWNKP